MYPLLLVIWFTYFSSRERDLKNGIGFVASHAVNYTLHITLLNVFIGVGISLVDSTPY